MCKLRILLTIFCFSSISYASSFHIPEEEKYKDFTFTTFSESRQSVQEKFDSFDLTEMLQAPRPTFKKIESINLDFGSQVTVYELFEGETKITSKKAVPDMGKYLYIPEINEGVALIASGHDFVAAAHFVENNEKNMLAFLRNLNDQSSPIDTLTIYGGFCSEVTSDLGRILKEENIKINFARVFPVLVFGDMKRGSIETSNIYACIEKLIDHHESFESKESLMDLFDRLKIFPCRVVVDCSDGSLIDLRHPIKIIPSEILFKPSKTICMPKEFNLNSGVVISEILNLKVLVHLVKMKSRGEITQKEFDYRIGVFKIKQ